MSSRPLLTQPDEIRIAVEAFQANNIRGRELYEKLVKSAVVDLDMLKIVLADLALRERLVSGLAGKTTNGTYAKANPENPELSSGLPHDQYPVMGITGIAAGCIEAIGKTGNIVSGLKHVLSVRRAVNPAS